MRKAIYLEGKEKTLILANYINKDSYEKIYKGNLLCPMEGCNAKLGFRQVKKQRDRKYFYTLPKNKHRIDCPYRIQGKIKKIRRQKGGALKENSSQIAFEFI